MKNEQHALDEGLRHLKEMGVDARLAGRQQSRAIEISAAGRKHRFLVDLKESLRPTDVGPVLMVSARLRDSVIVAPRISRAVAERLRDGQIHYLDATGNAYFTGPGLKILLDGRRPQKREPAPAPDRAFRPAGLKLVFALLSRPDLVESNYRELARVANISLGSVAKIAESLEDLGFLSRIRGNLRLVDRESLLIEWAKQYGRVMLGRDVLGRFSAPESKWWRKATPKLGNALWGGEVAAAHLMGHLRPEEISIYSGAIPRSVVQAFRLRKGESGAIVIRRKFWHFDHDLQQSKHVVPPPLIYAELLANGDARSVEAAKAIEENYIRGSLQG